MRAGLGVATGAWTVPEVGGATGVCARQSPDTKAARRRVRNAFINGGDGRGDALGGVCDFLSEEWFRKILSAGSGGSRAGLQPAAEAGGNTGINACALRGRAFSPREGRESAGWRRAKRT